MPGIHFFHSNDQALSHTKWDVLLDRQLHDEAYAREDVYTDTSFRLAVTRYAQYPVRVIDTLKYLIVLEGHLYGVSESQMQTDLEALGDCVFGEANNAETTVKSWLLDHDGDFVVVMRQKTSGSWALLNDIFGRLPLYRYGDRNMECYSREISLASHLPATATPDPLGMAQYLVFGYPLGPRMLWKDVKRLPPATIVRWRNGSDTGESTTATVFNFEYVAPVRTAAAAAEMLIPLFLNACRNRADQNGHNLLSLSGGLDSRSVAVGLAKAGCNFRAATFSNSSEPPSADLNVARKIASELNLDWSQIDLPAPAGKAVREIFRLKDGLINSSQAYDVPYFAQLRSRYSRETIHFSGDGGDKTLPCLYPEPKFDSVRQLAKYILDRHRLMRIPEAEKLTRLSPGTLVAGLTSLLETYPETSPAHKYVHFMIYERAIHWLFEGEDRNRCAFWSCTPFYSPMFFSIAMGCSSALKKNHALYREFLVRLSPTAAGVVDAGKGYSLIDPAYARRIALASWAARRPKLVRLGSFVLRRRSSYPAEAAIVQGLRQQLRREQALGAWLDERRLEFLAGHPGAIGRAAFENLFALSSTLIDHTAPDASAPFFSDHEFF